MSPKPPPHESPSQQPPEDITKWLAEAVGGSEFARNQLFEAIYQELHGRARRVMNGQREGHSLGATGLVHEVFLRLTRPRDRSWEGRAQFFAAAGKAMRSVLVDHARKRERRRSVAQPPSFFDAVVDLYEDRSRDLPQLSDAIERLAAWDPAMATAVDLRFFAGLEVEEVAQALQMSKRTFERHWSLARAWLKGQLQ